MTTTEAKAYRTGIQAMIDLATAAAEALKSRITEKPTRFNFAIAALEALADEGALMMTQAEAAEPSEPAAH